MKKLFTFLLVLATSIGMTRATQLWPILMDEQTYNTYGKYVVSDFRPNGTDRQFYVWSGTYNGISATGLNFFGNTEGYLAAAVASDWAGAGYCLTDMGTSWSKAKALQDAIVANPDNYFLHVAIKSADNFSHCFYLFDCEATKFVLGSHKVYNGALFSDFKRDGLWHDFYIPMSRFASALAANTACKAGVNIMALLTEGIPGAQLNLDAMYFCDKEMEELMHSNAEPAIPVEVNARVIDFTSSATSIDDWNISEATLNESESDEEKGKFVYDTKGGILSETSMKTELNVAFQYKNGSDKEKSFVVYPGKCYEFGGRNGVLIVKNTHLGDTIILTAAAKGSNKANFADPEGVYPINASALSKDLTLPEKGSYGADAQGFVWKELEYTSLGGDVQIKEFNAGYRIKMIQIKDAYYTLTTSNEDPKEGTTAGDKKALFASELKISATPNYGYHFAQWSDKNKQNPRSVILTQDTAFTAEFAKNTYTITTKSSNAEWGAAKGGKAALYLDEISISAVPNYGYHFTKWKDGDKQNPRKVIVTEDKTYTATFAKNVYNITMNAEHGNISGKSSAEYLDEVTMNVTADYGYHFAQWSDGNKQNPRTFVLTQDTAFTAEFAKNTYTITTNSSNAEWGAAKGGKAALYLDEISISAVPNYGYHFTQWTDGNKQNPRTVQVTEDKTYTATFAKNVYNITMNAEHGNISGKSSAEYLDEVTMNVTADYGYHFAQWSDGKTDNPRTFVLTQDTAFTAEFAKNTYTITTNSSNAEWGAAKGGKAALYLDEISISAVPNYGYHFTQWNDGDKQNPRTIQVTEDKTYTAAFAKNVYNITMNAEHGNISGKSSAEYLDEVTMNVTADYGYHFAQWSDGKTDNPRTFVLTQDTAFTAEFAKNTYTIKFLDWDGKELKSESVEHGSAATAPADPTRKGYTFTGWDKKFDNITEDLTLTAQYEEIDYTPQNLKAALVLQEEDVLITLSWDKVEGAASYELRVAVGEKELFSQNTMGINAIASLLSSIAKEYNLPAGTYTINWFVRSTDEEGKAISDWAQGEDFEVTIKDPATGLDRIQDTHVHSTKMLIDGVLYIERNGVLYDANGRIAQ